MCRKTELTELYDHIAANNTAAKVFLGRLRQDQLPQEKIDNFLDKLRKNTEVARVLDQIIEFERQLIRDFEEDIGELENMADSLLGKDTTEEDGRNVKELINNIDDIIEAMKVAYFQIGAEYQQHEERFYNAKEEVLHVVPSANK